MRCLTTILCGFFGKAAMLFPVFIAVVMNVYSCEPENNFWVDFRGGLFEGASQINDNDYMELYVKYLDDLDISFSYPSSFHLTSIKTEKPYFFCPNPDFKSPFFYGYVGGGAYAPPYESESGEALILYPLLIDFNHVCPDDVIESELICAYSNDGLDCTNLVNRIKGDNISESTNVDQVILYDFKIPVPVESKFTHCVGIALRKRNHYAMPIKLLLTDEGLQDRDRYVDIVLNSIRYGDEAKPEWIDAEGVFNWEEGKFPLKRWEFRGLRNF